MSIDNRELNTVRELSATEIEQVSGGGYIGNTSPFTVFWTPPKPPKPLQA
jgi:hypothetical protein